MASTLNSTKKPNSREGLRAVLVKYHGLLYTCQAMDFGWLCGQCGHGALGINPRLGKKCLVCAAKVVEKS